MYQIDSSTAASSQPASTALGTPGFFTDGNPATGTLATIVPAEWLNAVMLELANVVTGAGLTLNKAAFNQLLSAIRAIGRQSVVLADTGAVNAYAAANPTPLVSGVSGTLVHGVRQSVQITNANTGASTYAPDGLAAKPIYGLNLSPLQGGELPVGGVANMIYMVSAAINSGNGAWILLECTGGALQVPAGTQSNHAVNLGQFAATLSANGYVKIPVLVGGAKLTLIIQWGSVAAVSAGGGATWTFPIAFPNAYLNGVAAFNNTGGIGGSAAGGIGGVTNSNAVLFNNGSAGASQISAIVVGW